MARCAHLDAITVLDLPPDVAGCADCLRTGDRWVHLRMCQSCGHVGCCDSSPNRHARRHAESSGHPVVRSAEPGERWSYCFVDDVAFVLSCGARRRAGGGPGRRPRRAGRFAGMDEIAPGIHHWTAMHPRIGARVHSAYVAPARALIDPLVPEEGLAAFDGLPRPEVVLLTNRHHYRQSDRFAEAFGCRVRASAPGMHEFEGTDRVVEPFAWGEEVAPGIVAHEVGVLCPDESALHIAVGAGALAVADGIVQWGGPELTFVPDHLLGDDPEAIKRGLRASYARLLELEFDALLLAHGDPVATGAKEALRAFAAG